MPIAFHLASPRRAETVFTEWKGWLIRNNVVVTVVLLIAFGTLLLGRGLRVLGMNA